MIILPLQNGHYLIKSFIDGRGLKLDIHKRCEFSKEEDDKRQNPKTLIAQVSDHIISIVY